MGLQVKASLGILSAVFVGIFYQVFVQLPNMKYDLTQQMNQQQKEADQKISSLERRIYWLESKLHKE